MRLSYFYKQTRMGLLLLALCIAGYSIHAQNLVLNPSFESVNALRCSWYTSQAQFNSNINNWTCPTGGSTDIFNTGLATSCYCNPFSTHASNPGQQAPRTGNGYCNIVTYGNGGCTPWREYLQGELSANLQAGVQYEVSFWVTLADKMAVGTNNIGVKFENGAYSQASNCPYYTTPDLNYTGPIILDKTNWVQIYFTYTPTVSTISHFIIGNFFNDGATSTAVPSGVRTGNTIRYYVEDVVIQPLTILPVELNAFTAECTKGRVFLNWETATEADCDYYVLERGQDGIYFHPIADVESQGGANTGGTYNWTDANPLEGNTYYRLKQVGLDGDITYSDIVSVECNELDNKGISVYPNPFYSNFNIALGSDVEDPVRVTVLDYNGTAVFQQQYAPSNGQIELSLGDVLPSGVYVVKVDSGDIRYIQKIVKM